MTIYNMTLGGLASTCWHTNLALVPLATTWLTCLSRDRRDLARLLNIPSVVLLKEFLPEGVSVAMYYCLHWEQVTYLFHYVDATNCHLTEREVTECLWAMILSIKPNFFFFFSICHKYYRISNSQRGLALHAWQKYIVSAPSGPNTMRFLTW